MRYNRLLPILIPFLVFVLFEIFLFNNKTIYASVAFANLLILFAIRQFARAGLQEKEWTSFLILPVLFITGLATYSALFSSKFIVHFLFIVNVVFLYFYLRTAYYYLVKPLSSTNLTLDNISSYGNFLVFFFFASAIYGLQSFLNISVGILMSVLVFIVALIVHQALWANKVNIKIALSYILVSSLILVELGWAISFWPLDFNVSGLILAICYYILIGLIRFHLLDKLDKRIIELYLISGFSSIIILLLTARWM